MAKSQTALNIIHISNRLLFYLIHASAATFQFIVFKLGLFVQNHLKELGLVSELRCKIGRFLLSLFYEQVEQRPRSVVLF